MSEYTPVKTLWVTPLVTVVPVEVDYDLNTFYVYRNGDAVYLGTVDPDGLDAQEALVKDLNEGGCPVDDRWEDGKGNTCGIDGWLTEEEPSESNFAEVIQILLKNRAYDVHDFFMGDTELLQEYLAPAYDALRADVPKLGPDGLYDADEVGRYLTFTRPSGENTFRRSGSALCLVPYVGQARVTIEDSIDLSRDAAMSARQLISILEDEEVPAPAKTERSKDLKHLLDEVVALDERYVVESVNETITVNPVKEETTN